METIPRADAAAQMQTSTKLVETEAAARRETPKKTAVAGAPAAAVEAKTPPADATTGSTSAVESVKPHAAESPVKTAAVVESQKTPAGSIAKLPAVQPTAKADVESSPPVTITGCVELDEQTFWLTDTTGVDAPRARSWRSGFLKKRSSNIELVDASHALKLPSYVGQRVTATGILTKRELRAHSVQRIAASCS